MIFLRSLVALLSVKLLTLGIIQVNLILHSLTRNIVSVGMTGSRFDLAYIELTLYYHLPYFSLDRYSVCYVQKGSPAKSGE